MNSLYSCVNIWSYGGNSVFLRRNRPKTKHAWSGAGKHPSKSMKNQYNSMETQLKVIEKQQGNQIIAIENEWDQSSQLKINGNQKRIYASNNSNSISTNINTNNSNIIAPVPCWTRWAAGRRCGQNTVTIRDLVLILIKNNLKSIKNCLKTI